jgi:hypothetical protein
MGEMRSALRNTLEQFHAFHDVRPKEEKWELGDGHDAAANAGSPAHCTQSRVPAEYPVRARAPDWQAYREIGLLLADNDRYNPEPDVTVIETAIDLGQIYATEFYFVGEVLSPDDKPHVLDLKRGFYTSHEPCRGVIIVAQDRVSARLDNGWQGRAWCQGASAARQGGHSRRHAVDAQALQGRRQGSS